MFLSPHNVYIITDGVPTDDPCAYAQAFNTATELDHVTIVVVGFTSMDALSCFNHAEFIFLSNFAALECPNCQDLNRMPCSSITCPAGYQPKKGISIVLEAHALLKIFTNVAK